MDDIFYPLSIEQALEAISIGTSVAELASRLKKPAYLVRKALKAHPDYAIALEQRAESNIARLQNLALELEGGAISEKEAKIAFEIRKWIVETHSELREIETSSGKQGGLTVILASDSSENAQS